MCSSAVNEILSALSDVNFIEPDHYLTISSQVGKTARFNLASYVTSTKRENDTKVRNEERICFNNRSTVWNEASTINETGDSSLSSDQECFTPPQLPCTITTICSMEDVWSTGSDLSADSLDTNTEITSLASTKKNSSHSRYKLEDPRTKALPINLLNDIRLQSALLEHKDEFSKNFLFDKDLKRKSLENLPVAQPLHNFRKSADESIQRTQFNQFLPNVSICKETERCSESSQVNAISNKDRRGNCASYRSSNSLEDLYQFHLRENLNQVERQQQLVDDLNFIGHKDILNVDKSATIRSNNGTVRGVRNRVRAGINTFIQGKTSKVSKRIVILKQFAKSIRIF